MNVYRLIVFGFAVTTSFAATADVSVSAIAEFADADKIAQNVRNECDLPNRVGKTVHDALKDLDISMTVAEHDVVPSNGKFLRVRISDAVSRGAAGASVLMGGHRKSLTLTGVLFDNGVEVAHSKFTRDSMGGAMGRFRSSCNVLVHCANSASYDLAKWLRKELKNSSASAPASGPQVEDTGTMDEKN
jgi:hypothetical protein